MVEGADKEPLLFGFLIDISQQKNAEANLLAERDFIQAVLDNAPVLVFTRRNDGLIDYTNRATEEFVKNEIVSVSGPDPFEAGPPATGSADGASCFQDVIESRVTTKLETAYQFDNGELRTLQTTMVPVQRACGATGVLGVSVDVTVLKAAETEAARANEAKSAFLAAISHEIRTPMNGVLGITGLLDETPLSAEQGRMVGTIRESGQHLMRLINDILDFSKIEASALMLEPEEFRVSSALNYVADLLAPKARESGLDLVLRVDGDVPETLIGDIGRLQQILVNLLSNALKFTPAGGVSLSVSLVRTRKDDVIVSFTVLDTGIGISPEDQTDLFEPFTQVSTRRARLGGGAGLGLAISKRLVTLMDGTMTVESTVGVGSRFSFAVPLGWNGTGAAADFGFLAGRSVVLAGLPPFVTEQVRAQLGNWDCDVQIAETVSDEAAEAADAVIAAPSAVGGATFRRNMVLFERGVVNAEAAGTPSEALRAPVTADRLRACLYRVFLVGEAAIPPDVAPATDTIEDGQVLELIPPTSAALRELAAGKSRKLRILVAEDNTVNQIYITRLLEKLGHRSDVVQNGYEAVQAVRDIPYDIVLMDVRMPELDGIEATRRIRELHQTASQTVIIAMTADVLDATADACREAGMDGFLPKPIDRQAVADKLSELVSTGRLENRPSGTDFQSFGAETDKEMLEELLDVLGQEEYGLLLQTTTRRVVETMPDLVAAVRRGNADLVVHLMHSQSSSLGHLGLSRARRMAETIERECRNLSEAVLIEQLEAFTDCVLQSAAHVESDLLARR